MARFFRRQQGTVETNCRLADVLLVQYVLDAAASMTSGATFWGICDGQYLAAVTTAMVYGTGVARTKLGIKTPAKSVMATRANCIV